MSKMLIEFNEDESHLLKVMAANHGQAVKPFVEYLVKMQIGVLPAPTAKPLHIPAQGVTLKEPAKEAQRKDTKAVAPAEVKAEDFSGSGRHVTFAEVMDIEEAQENERTKAQVKEVPRKVAAVTPTKVEPAQIPAQGFTINKDVNAYKERVESGIFTDGKHFFVNRFGTKTFHTSLESARIAKA